jgi:hypothetical protein
MKTAGKHRAARRRRTCPSNPEKQTRSSDAASSPIVQLPVCCGRPWDDPNTRRKVKPIKPIGWTRSMPLPCLSFGVNGRTQDDFKTCISHPHQESSHTVILGTVQDAYPAGVHCPSRLLPSRRLPLHKTPSPRSCTPVATTPTFRVRNRSEPTKWIAFIKSTPSPSETRTARAPSCGTRS